MFWAEGGYVTSPTVAENDRCFKRIAGFSI